MPSCAVDVVVAPQGAFLTWCPLTTVMSPHFKSLRRGGVPYGAHCVGSRTEREQWGQRGGKLGPFDPHSGQHTGCLVISQPGAALRAGGELCSCPACRMCVPLNLPLRHASGLLALSNCS